jgi:GDP-L-fucose synthase
MTDTGYDITAVDNLISESALHPDAWPSHLQPNRKFEFIEEDARSYFTTCKEKFDIVIHLAAIVGGRLKIENAPLQVAEDLSLDAEMFNWVSKYSPEKLVFFSSSAAYPISVHSRENHVILREDVINLGGHEIGKPDLSYGWAKLTGEYLAKLAYERCGIKSVCFRPFSGFGEDQHTNYPFPSILKRCLAYDGNPITVWSTGEQSRDFIYIDDCVDGMLHMMDQIEDGSAVNLSTGRPTSFLDLIRIMCKRIHGVDDVEFNRLLDKPEGVFYRVGDTQLQRSLGFKEKYSLEEAIDRSTELIE